MYRQILLFFQLRNGKSKNTKKKNVYVCVPIDGKICAVIYEIGIYYTRCIIFAYLIYEMCARASSYVPQQIDGKRGERSREIGESKWIARKNSMKFNCKFPSKSHIYGMEKFAIDVIFSTRSMCFLLLSIIYIYSWLMHANKGYSSYFLTLRQQQQV